MVTKGRHVEIFYEIFTKTLAFFFFDKMTFVIDPAVMIVSAAAQAPRFPARAPRQPRHTGGCGAGMGVRFTLSC